jgi:bifunctional UDP-N-acetylglucosamine pyrophosphorylase/glucosamine-1-phosphate N-acetyltransferase
MESFGAIMLAAGRGVRMKSDRAKVLHPILGTPIIRLALRAVREAGADPVVVVVGHQADEVRAALAGEPVVFVEQAEQKGTGHAVLLCEKAVRRFRGPLVVMYGDTPMITASTLGALVAAHRRASAAPGRGNTAATLLTVRLVDPTGYGRILRDRKGAVAGIVEEADATPEQRQIEEINPGFYVFDPAALFTALRRIRPDNRKGEYYLTDVIRILCMGGSEVKSVSTKDPAEVLGVNSRRDLAAATEILRRREIDRHLDGGVTIVDPAATYIEAGVEIGADTTVFPFTVIRSGVRIGRHCEVGPFAHLRGATVLEDGAEVGNYVEVKASRFGALSKAKHLSYLGDASIGARVNIGAGTITANYDGKSKHPTIIEDEASTGSGTVLIAPVRIGRGAKTGAGAIVTRGKDVPPGATAVGVPARVLGAAVGGASVTPGMTRPPARMEGGRSPKGQERRASKPAAGRLDKRKKGG